MNNEEKIKQAAEILSKAKNIVGFTGAGTSAESGIPPFRGEGGIWNQYDPNSLDIDFYYRHTKESWKIIREVFYEGRPPEQRHHTEHRRPAHRGGQQRGV